MVGLVHLALTGEPPLYFTTFFQVSMSCADFNCKQLSVFLLCRRFGEIVLNHIGQ